VRPQIDSRWHRARAPRIHGELLKLGIDVGTTNAGSRRPVGISASAFATRGIPATAACKIVSDSELNAIGPVPFCVQLTSSSIFVAHCRQHWGDGRAVDNRRHGSRRRASSPIG
jgi:hypothetical protein